MKLKSQVKGLGGIEVKVIADSTSTTTGVRLTTMSLRYPRFIHSEFMTHRVFSRNASSSRAIPVEKMLNKVLEDTAQPIHWGTNKPGMQAGAEGDRDRGQHLWGAGRDAAVLVAKHLNKAGFHKQVVNRITEPYQFINVVMTSTQWGNFFELRDHPAAQPEFGELARTMKEAMRISEPDLLEPKHWHVPYYEDGVWTPDHKATASEAIDTSVACCARVSYMNHEGKHPTKAENQQLAKRLADMKHLSPFEHQATPMRDSGKPLINKYLNMHQGGDTGWTHVDRYGNFWSGNLCGWVQFRQMMEQV